MPRSHTDHGPADASTPGERPGIGLLAGDAATAAAVRSGAADRLVPVEHQQVPADGAVADALGSLAAAPAVDAVIVAAPASALDRGVLDAARAVTPETPVVAHAPVGADPAPLPVGPPPDEALAALLGQAGVLVADSLSGALDAGAALAGLPLPAGPGVAIVSNAGGPGVMTADAVGAAGLEAATFAEETVARLAGRIGDEGSAGNPIDVLGDADLDLFRDALDAALADEDVGAAVVLSAPSALFEFASLAERIADVQAAHGTPVVACLMGGERARPAAERLAAAGIPSAFDPWRAVESLAALWRYRDRRARAAEPTPTLDEVIGGSTDGERPSDGADPLGMLAVAGVATDPGAPVEGVRVTVRATGHSRFGAHVAAGVEGWDDAMGDVAVRTAPLGAPAALRLLDDLRAAPLLHGARGGDPVDEAALASAVQRISALAARWELDVLSVELDATPTGATAVAAEVA